MKAKLCCMKNRVLLRVQEGVCRMLEKREKGESHLMSVILVIVIILGVIFIFREKLTEIVNLLFGKVTGFMNDL